MGVKIDLHQAAIDALLYSPTGPVVQAVENNGRRIQNKARQLAPVDEGTLRASIFNDISISVGRHVKATIGSLLKYAIYVHEGTGLFGPKHRLIRPRTAKALRFKPKGATAVVFAKYTRGQDPNPFLIKAFVQAPPIW